MKRRKFKNTLVSFALVLVVGVSYVGNGLILNKIADRKKHNNSKVEYNPNNKISGLGFSYSSVQSFIDSLQNFVYLNDCNSLKRVSVVATNTGDVLEMYVNESKTLVVTSSAEGKVVSCKFSNLSVESEKEVRKLATKYKGSGGFSIKEVNNGFILEGSTL